MYRSLRALGAAALLTLAAGCDSTEEPEGELLIEELQAGTGQTIANLSIVSTVYEVRLEDGTVVAEADSADPHVTRIGAHELLEGMEEGLIGMREGGRRRLTIPPHLAFGDAGWPQRGVPSDATVIVDIGLLPGVAIEEISAGTGGLAGFGSIVNVHYTGTLEDGSVFDTSRDGDDPLVFQIGTWPNRGSVIPGFEQAIDGMRVGGKRRVTIPAYLAYGAQGSGTRIPPNATIVFEVELVAVR